MEDVEEQAWSIAIVGHIIVFIFHRPWFISTLLYFSLKKNIVPSSSI